MSPLKLVVFLVNILGILALCGGDNDYYLSNIATCLINNGVKNFTVYPKNDDPISVTNYFKLLDFSIQNLRFAESSDPKPAAIIMPKSKNELVKSVSCGRNGSWEIRARSGGHSYEGISSVGLDGSRFVIIDMMNLDGVDVDLETKTSWVEGGATLGQTYYAISRVSEIHGFSAGSCSTVGVGGHISGGGFGLLSRKYGLAADNVVDAVLVDADGRILDRAGMGEDVFWAIRGGGGGMWGIIYAWKIKLLDVPKTVTGFIVSKPGTKQYLSRLVHKWQHVAPNLDNNFYLSAFIGAGLQSSVGLSASFKGFYLGRSFDALSILDKVFPELGVTEEDCKEMSWIESVFFSGLNDDDNFSLTRLTDRYLEDKSFFKAKSDYVKTPIPITGIKTALCILEKQPKGYVILDPYGGAMQNKSEESIAFPHRKGNLFRIQYLVEWDENENDKSKDFIKWIRGFYSTMASYVSKSPRAAYVNYMDLDLGSINLGTLTAPEDAVEKARLWGEKYFLNNYDRLVRAKTIIDPHNVFSHQQGIPPIANATSKLSQAYYSLFSSIQKQDRNVIPVRLHFCETIPQARQPISHRRICVNNGMVNITHFKLSQSSLSQ